MTTSFDFRTEPVASFALGEIVELLGTDLRSARKRIEDEFAFENIKDTEAYKHFRKMMEGEK